MSNIITFYSYKGGVGRSMALANIAFELAKRNKKVLMVDWDLEAPGLERYFSNFKIDNQAEGLMALLLEYEQGNSPDYKNYIWTIHTGNEIPLHLLPSGRERDPAKYSAQLEKFDWNSFFVDKKGGVHLENLRDQWLNDFDAVLIDSRTGLSDASGICTIMLPDIIIPMFTANYQSLFGIRDTVKYIQAARQKLAVDRMGLTILPVPSRFGTRVEFKESQEWLDRIADLLKDCFSDWLPKWIAPRYIFEQVKIPQVDYFSFGEKLAVVEQGTNDPEGMGYVYSKLAALIASDFNDLPAFVGVDYYQSQKEVYEKENLKNAEKEKPKEDFIYDVFLSCPRDVYQWARELLIPALIEYLPDELGYTPNIFRDFYEGNSGGNFMPGVQDAAQKSSVMLIISPTLENDSSYLRHLVSSFEERSKLNNVNLIFPVLLKEGVDVKFDTINETVATDLRFLSYDDIIKSTKARVIFGRLIEKLAVSMGQSIKQTLTEKAKANKSKNNHIYNSVAVLASEYESIRKNFPSGNHRTSLMENVVSKMKDNAYHIQVLLPQLINSASPGERLAAITTLQVFPDVKYVDWLSKHVGDVEKPFVGYHSSVALYSAARSLGGDYKYEVSKSLSNAFESLNKYEFKDPNQVSVLNSAMKELATK